MLLRLLNTIFLYVGHDTVTPNVLTEYDDSPTRSDNNQRPHYRNYDDQNDDEITKPSNRNSKQEYNHLNDVVEQDRRRRISARSKAPPLQKRQHYPRRAKETSKKGRDDDSEKPLLAATSSVPEEATVEVATAVTAVRYSIDESQDHNIVNGMVGLKKLPDFWEYEEDDECQVDPPPPPPRNTCTQDSEQEEEVILDSWSSKKVSAGAPTNPNGSQITAMDPSAMKEEYHDCLSDWCSEKVSPSASSSSLSCESSYDAATAHRGLCPRTSSPFSSSASTSSSSSASAPSAVATSVSSIVPPHLKPTYPSPPETIHHRTVQLSAMSQSTIFQPSPDIVSEYSVTTPLDTTKDVRRVTLDPLSSSQHACAENMLQGSGSDASGRDIERTCEATTTTHKRTRSLTVCSSDDESESDVDDDADDDDDAANNCERQKSHDKPLTNTINCVKSPSRRTKKKQKIPLQWEELRKFYHSDPEFLQVYRRTNPKLSLTEFTTMMDDARDHFDDDSDLNVHSNKGSRTYGKILPLGVDAIQNELELKPGDIFIDLGHGVGNAPIQTAATSDCIQEARGIEIEKDRFERSLEYCQYLGTFGVELVLGDLTDPTHRRFLTRGGIIKAFANNYDGFWSHRGQSTSSEMSKPALDDYLAGLFAHMPPGSILITLSPLRLGTSLAEAHKLERLHRWPHDPRRSFFSEETIDLGSRGVTYSWNEDQEHPGRVEAYKYTRLEQYPKSRSSDEKSRVRTNLEEGEVQEEKAVFLCINPRCVSCINTVPIPATKLEPVTGKLLINDTCDRCNMGHRKLRGRR